MEDLSKYLPLYLGQKVLCLDHKLQRTLVGFCEVAVTPRDGYRIQVRLDDRSNVLWYDIDEIKLILRPLSSMTEEEGKALGMGWETRWDKNGVPHTLFQPEAFIKLIEWGFDIFRLKEKGLALYPEDL